MVPKVRGWSIAASIFVALAIAFATLTPDAGTPDVDHGCVICGSLGGVDAVLNVLLFVPLGIALAFAGLRGPTAVGVMSLFSVCIELLQATVIPGRFGTLADVITNSAGSVVGFLAGIHGLRLVRPHHVAARRLALGWLILWTAGQGVVAYALLPVTTSDPYFGRIRRPHRDTGAQFPGNVLDARIGPERLTNGPLAKSDAVRAAYASADGVAFEMTVIPGRSTVERVEIVMVGGENGGIASFEQSGRDLIFGARTGADAMRLRPLWFRIVDLFPADTGSAVPMRVFAQYGRSTVVLQAREDTRQRTLRLVHRLSYGWVVVNPMNVFLDGTIDETIVGALWLIAILLPAGYWGALATGHERRRGWHLLPAVAVTAFVTAFLLVPLLVGMRPAAPWEYMCSAAGLALGAGLSRYSGIPGTSSNR